MVIIMNKDTIAAISTALGQGAISIVRLSGDEAKYLEAKTCPLWNHIPFIMDIFTTTKKLLMKF